MPKYRKKPVVIESIQWDGTGKCCDELDKFFGKPAEVRNTFVMIETLEGVMSARVGDYIIKGVNGEFYPCKEEIFKKTYELAEEYFESL